MASTTIVESRKRKKSEQDVENPEVLLADAEKLALNGRLDEAERAAVAVLLQDDASPGAYNLLGFINHSRGMLNDALSCFEKAYSLAPQDIDTGKNLLGVCLELGLVRDVHRVSNELLSISPDDEELLQIRAALPEVFFKPSLDKDYPSKRITLNRTISRGKVLLVVCLYENNFGDKLIYHTIDKKLRDRGFDMEPVEISRPISESGLIERANASDFLYFVGGGIIERWAPEIISNFDKIQPRLKVPYGVVGLSTGSFDYSEFHNSLKLFCDGASFFFTRDEETVDVFKKAGAAKPPIVGVDVVFANDTLSKLRAVGNRISASFRNVPYPDVTGDMDWKAWGAALDKIGVESLIPDCSDAQNQMGLPLNPDPILRQLVDSSVVIAMRYHIILAAVMMGALPIPISYCPKVTRLALQLGIEDYCLGIHDHDKLEQTVSRLKANEADLRRHIAQKTTELEYKANELVNQSIEVMEQAING